MFRPVALRLRQKQRRRGLVIANGQNAQGQSGQTLIRVSLQGFRLASPSVRPASSGDRSWTGGPGPERGTTGTKTVSPFYVRLESLNSKKGLAARPGAVAICGKGPFFGRNRCFQAVAGPSRPDFTRISQSGTGRSAIVRHPDSEGQEVDMRGLRTIFALFMMLSCLAWGPAQAATVVALGASNTFGKGVARNCSIPDDHIDPRRSAFFMARSILRDIRSGVRAC